MSLHASRGRLRLVASGGAGPAMHRPAPAGEEGAPGRPAPATPALRTSPLGALTDRELVLLARGGDARAAEALYLRHARFALNLAARVAGDPRDAEDVVQDAFLRCFERLNELAEPAAFRCWLGAVVVHAVRSRLRRQRLLGLLGLGRGADPVDLDAIASPDASPHVRAQLAQLYALLRTLPLDDRIAWTLRHVEGHELEAAASLTRCSLATVKRRIARAQRFLEEHYIHAERGEGARS